MKLILSIGKKNDIEQRGIISLWDSTGSLPEDEHSILLELTDEQIKQLTFDGVKPVNVID